MKYVNTRIDGIKDRFFNMDISQHLEAALRNRIRVITIVTGLFALIALYFMFQTPSYFLASLLIGIIAMIVDFIIEYTGISKNAWDYPTKHISFRKVPLEVPILFFNCGILATFAFRCFSTPEMIMLISTSAIAGFSFVQVVLFIIGAFFMFQYFRGAVKSLVFGALPIGIGIYLLFPEPWVLVISILPMYIDYYLEKRLVKSAHIQYDRYDEEVATNVAISYFPATLFIFGCIAIVLNLIEV